MLGSRELSRQVCIREVRPSFVEALPATVILGPADRAGGGVLALKVSNHDAHALEHEVRQRETLRSQSLRLAARIVGACEASMHSIQLQSVAPGVVRSAVRIVTGVTYLDIPAEPGQCLALATVLQLPMFASDELFLDATEGGCDGHARESQRNSISERAWS